MGCELNRFPSDYEDKTSQPRHNRKLPGPCFKTDDTTLVNTTFILQRYHCLFNKYIIPYMPYLAITIWFQALFTPQKGYFSAFPHGTSTLSVLRCIQDQELMPPIHTRYPTHPTQEKSQNPKNTISTGLSPSTVQPFQADFNLHFRASQLKSTHHIFHNLQSGIQFVLHRFRSPLLTISIFLSLPPLTKMFQFSGFPIPTDQYLKKYQEVPLGNLGFKGCMLLAQAYRSLPRPSQATQAKPSPRQYKQHHFLIQN